MVSRKVIDELYRKFRHTPGQHQLQLMVDTLTDIVGEAHNLSIGDRALTIGTLEETSPFRSIMLRHIHGVAIFERSAAIVLNNSILFLNRNDHDVNIHFKPNPQTWWEKVKWMFVRS